MVSEQHNSHSSAPNRELEVEARLRAILNAALDCIVSFDPEERIIDFNPAAERTFGYRRDEVIRRQVVDLLLPPALRNRERKSIERYLETGEGSMLGRRVQTTAYRKDGTEFFAEFVIQPVPYDGGLVFTLFLRDITERKVAEQRLARANDELKAEVTERRRAETDLQRERDLLRTLMDQLPDYVFVKDKQTRLVTTNAAHLRVLGSNSLQDVVGKTDFDFFPEALAAKYYADDRRVVTSGTPLINNEEETVLPSGERQWLITTKVPLRRPDHSVDGLIGICRDITARKQFEESLKHYAAELERSNRDLDDFASILAHDLHAPLRVLRSYCELLNRRLAKHPDAESSEFTAQIVDGAKRMQRLIDDLRTYSRVASQAQPQKTIDSENVLSAAMKNLQSHIAESSATITHDPLPSVTADETQLVQVFQNLLGNAIKYCGERSPAIHIAAERTGREWLFRVRDNGIGIEPSQAKAVFRIFNRLHASDEYPGTGIGLAICKRVIERHGGRIWVESQPGVGSTFCFTVPYRGRETT